MKRTILFECAPFALSCLYFVCQLNALVIVDFSAGKTASNDYALGADACFLYWRI